MSELSDDLLSRYHRDGFVFPLRVMSVAETRRCRDALERAELAARDRDERSLLHGYSSMLLPEVDDLSRDARIAGPVSSILGPDLLLWGAGFFIKEPGAGTYVSWHQDLNYWGLDDAHEVTAWVAFTDATPHNGAMRFLGKV